MILKLIQYTVKSLFVNKNWVLFRYYFSFFCLVFTNRLFLGLDKLVFGSKLNHIPVKSPVFFLAHFRSGSSFLHHTLHQSDRFCKFRYFDMLFPSLIFKKLFGQSLLKSKSFTDQFVIDQASGHPANILSMEEEDTFLSLFGQHSISATSTLHFCPEKINFIFDEDAKQCKYTQKLKLFIQKQIFITGDSRILAQPISSLLRYRHLIACFPDARIIIINRSPLETIPSALSLTRYLLVHNRAFQFNQAEESKLVKIMYRYSLQFYGYLNHLLVTRVLTPDNHLMIQYPEIRSNITDVIHRIAEYADIPLSDKFIRKITETREQQANYQRVHTVHSLQSFGLSEAQIYQDFDFYFKNPLLNPKQLNQSKESTYLKSNALKNMACN